MRTLRIYSLNNLPIYHTAVLAIVFMLKLISLILIVYFVIGSLCVLTTFLQFCLLLHSKVVFFEMQLMILLLEKNFVVFMLQFPSLQFVLTQFHSQYVYSLGYL